MYGIKRTIVWVLILYKLFPILTVKRTISQFLCFWGRDSSKWIFYCEWSVPPTSVFLKDQPYVCVSHISVNSCWHWGCFHALTIVNNTLVNMEGSHLFDILYPFALAIKPEVGNAGSYLKNIPALFHFEFTYLYSHKQHLRIPFSPHVINTCYLLSFGY